MKREMNNNFGEESNS